MATVIDERLPMLLEEVRWGAAAFAEEIAAGGPSAAAIAVAPALSC